MFRWRAVCTWSADFEHAKLQNKEEGTASGQPYKGPAPSKNDKISKQSGESLLHSEDFLMTSSPTPRRNRRRNVISTTDVDSESGISSKTSSMLMEETSQGQSMSAPSTPLVPPRWHKPGSPTLPQPLDFTANNVQRGPAERVTFGTPMERGVILRSSSQQHTDDSILSAPRASPEPSLVNSLVGGENITMDASFHSYSPGQSIDSRPNALQVRDKIFQILVQTREFLFYEINPENILPYLCKHGVISPETDRELRQCSSRQIMCESLLDYITAKGEEEFMIFCDSLRVVENRDYLADLLIVLDKLIDTVTMNDQMVSRQGTRLSVGGDNPAFVGSSMSMNHDVTMRSCSACHCDNNNGEMDTNSEPGSFDIEIFYYNRESGELKPICDVATIKHKGRTRQECKKDESFLSKMDRENADKYIPVISLTLFNQCMYKQGIDTLAKLIEEHGCIRELSLAKNHMDPIAMKRLGEALEKNKGLVKLDIRLNTVCEESARYISSGIHTNLSLQTLNVTSSDVNGPACNILLNGLNKHSHLTDLDVSFNDIGNEGCKGLGRFLAANSNLKRLRMRDNGITSRGANVVFKALKRNCRLNFLDMSSNKIGGLDGSMGTLAEVLVHNRNLKELNLEKCDISKDGCASLARALKTNTSLKSLDLSMNPIRDEGVVALSEGIKYNQAMETICMNMCIIGNRGFLRLLETLRHNSSMATLKLCYNLIGCPDPVANDMSHVDSDTARLVEENGTTDGSVTPSIEELYDKLCDVLQFNSKLKLLLWGNKLDEPGTISCYPAFSS